MLTRCSFPAGGICRIAGISTLIGTICVIAIPLRADSSNGSIAERRTKTYEWFNTLGYPDVKDLNFVRVSTGETDYVGKTSQPRIVHGFLIVAAKDHFKVFADTTEISDYKRVPANASGKPGVDYQADDLLKYAEATLKSLRNPEAERLPSGLFPEHVNCVSKATEGFVVSWACWRKGHDKLAAELFDQAAGWRRGSDSDLSDTFQDRVAADLSSADALGSGCAVQSRHTTRPITCSIRKPPQSISKERRGISGSPDRGSAQGYGAGRQGPGGAARSQETVRPTCQEGSNCGVDLSASRPLQRVRRSDGSYPLGKDWLRRRTATDRGAGRQTTFSNGGVFRPAGVQYTVGDIAAEILSQIACRNFGGNLSPLSDPTHDESRLAGIKQEAETWYAEASRKGEKQMLVEATEKGDDDCLTPARRLAEKYPDAAVAAWQRASGMHRTARSAESSLTGWPSLAAMAPPHF